MRRMDEPHLARPFAGSHVMRDFLTREGVEIGRRHVATLTKRLGIVANYPRRNTSKRAEGQDLSLSAARFECRAAEPGLRLQHRK
jgi:putative transposase